MTWQLQRLLFAAICAGAISGVTLFVLQHATVDPLIVLAESYERDAPDEHEHNHVQTWMPEEGVERTAYTAIGTVLTGIGFAAVALGAVTALGIPLDVWRGLVLGLVGFASFVVAPSLGLPPTPPGVASAELAAAQTWWVSTAITTLVGFALIATAPRVAVAWIGACALFAIPHVAGAPVAPATSAVPADLVTRFAWMSVVSRLPFWLLIGMLGGHLLRPRPTPRAERSDARGTDQDIAVWSAW